MKNDTSTNTIGSRIRAAREEKGFSQSDLAEAIGFQSATAISLIENGERGVSAEILKKLSNALQRDVYYFLGEKEKAGDVQFALRADKGLTTEDRNAILHFIDLAKQKNGK